MGCCSGLRRCWFKLLGLGFRVPTGSEGSGSRIEGFWSPGRSCEIRVFPKGLRTQIIGSQGPNIILLMVSKP